MLPVYWFGPFLLAMVLLWLQLLLAMVLVIDGSGAVVGDGVIQDVGTYLPHTNC